LREPRPASSAASMSDGNAVSPLAVPGGTSSAQYPSLLSIDCASRRPTPWMRSVVPIVESSHGEVATQSPARGCAPPTTTTVRAPGSRSAGRCRAGAWASKAAASATPTTAAPALMAIVFRRFVAFEGNSVIVVAGAAWPARAVGGPREMRPGFVRSWYSVLRSLQLPVLAADGADAHALEALRDRVAEEPDRLQGLREEVGVDHLAAPPGV